MTTTQEKTRDLYGFDNHYGKPAEILFKPTDRSRKWRKAYTCPCFCREQEDIMLAIKQQEGWSAVTVET